MFLVTRPPICWKFDSYGFCKRTKQNKGWKWICENYNNDYFRIKITLKFHVKSLLHSIFSLITWNTKLKTKQHVKHPQQIVANHVNISWRAFRLLWILFKVFRISWCIHFWSLLNSHNLIFQLLFYKSNVNKTV